MWKKTPAKQTEAAFLMIRRRNDFCDKNKKSRSVVPLFFIKTIVYILPYLFQNNTIS